MVSMFVFARIEQLGELVEEVNVQGDADGHELLGINGGFEEYLLHSSGMDMDAFGEPFIGVALPSKLLSDLFSYVYTRDQKYVLLFF